MVTAHHYTKIQHPIPTGTLILVELLEIGRAHV